MKNRGKAILSIILTALMVPMVALNVDAKAVTSKPDSATITVKEDPNWSKNIVDAANYGKIVYDLYLIDDETYIEPIKEKLKQDSKLDLNKEYQELGKKVLGDLVTSAGNGTYTISATPAATGELNVGPLEVANGTYLLVPRGVANTGHEQDVDSIIMDYQTASADTNNTTITSQIVSFIRIGANYFTITPQIVTTPIKLNSKNEIVRWDSDEGTWYDHQDIYLKMLVDPEYGGIIIDKTMIGSPVRQESATCIFQVDVYFPSTNTKPYSSEVYSIIFTKDDFTDGSKTSKKRLEIGGMPLGSRVEVTERYSGSSYKADIAYPNGYFYIVPATGDNKPVVAFKNSPAYDKGGGGLTNHFEYTDKGDGIRWQWNAEWARDENGFFSGKYDNVTTTNGRIRQEIDKLLPVDRPVVANPEGGATGNVDVVNNTGN